MLNTDLGAQRLTVIENGKAKYTWPISSGRRGFATPTGTFHPQWASRMHYSRQYEYAPMPHAVFFHRGTAFHGTGAVGLLGQPASHGCVRLAPGNAAQLFKLVHKHGYASTSRRARRSSNREPAVRDGDRGVAGSDPNGPSPVAAPHGGRPLGVDGSLGWHAGLEPVELSAEHVARIVCLEVAFRRDEHARSR